MICHSVELEVSVSLEAMRKFAVTRSSHIRLKSKPVRHPGIDCYWSHCETESDRRDLTHRKPSKPSSEPLTVRTGALAYAFATRLFLSRTITLAQISSSICVHLSSTSCMWSCNQGQMTLVLEGPIDDNYKRHVRPKERNEMKRSRKARWTKLGRKKGCKTEVKNKSHTHTFRYDSGYSS